MVGSALNIILIFYLVLICKIRERLPFVHTQSRLSHSLCNVLEAGQKGLGQTVVKWLSYKAVGWGAR